jgi:hypothetical protein
MLFLVILVLSFASSYFLPWWAAAVIAFLAALFIDTRAGKAFLSGFAALFVAWTVLALLKSIPNDNILAGRVVQLFPLPNNWIWVLVVTAVVGGIVGGLSALSGALIRNVAGDKN